MVRLGVMPKKLAKKAAKPRTVSAAKYNELCGEYDEIREQLQEAIRMIKEIAAEVPDDDVRDDTFIGARIGHFGRGNGPFGTPINLIRDRVRAAIVRDTEFAIATERGDVSRALRHVLRLPAERQANLLTKIEAPVALK